MIATMAASTAITLCNSITTSKEIKFLGKEYMPDIPYFAILLCLIASGCWAGAMTTMHQANDLPFSANPELSSQQDIMYVAQVNKNGAFLNYIVAILFGVASILAYKDADKKYVWGTIGVATILFGMMAHMINTASERLRIR